MGAKTSAVKLANTKAASPAKGAVESVTFEPAKGGLISRTNRTSKGTAGSPSYFHSETAVHASIDDAVRHLKSTMGEPAED